MANILLATELPDLGRITVSGLNNVLAAVEKADTAAFYTGAELAATESPDQGSIIIEQRDIVVAGVESSDVGSVNVLQGVLITVAAVEAKDIGSAGVAAQILARIAAIEVPDDGAIDILQGNIVTLAAIEQPDTGIIAFSADTLVSMAALEAPDYGWLHVQEVPISFIRKAVVMNLTNYAVSEYKNYNFNSLLRFNGVFLGINEQGVYLLDGNDDLGQLIQARVKSGLEDLGGKGAMTIPREAWLSYRSNDGMQFDVVLDENTPHETMFFEKVVRLIRECRAKFDRGIKARFFTWDLKNVGGSDFSLQSLRILGDIIKRKTR